MARECGGPLQAEPTDPCTPPGVRVDDAPRCGCGPRQTRSAATPSLAHFAEMIPNALDYAKRCQAEGRPVVGILCEFTPREVIMAAGCVPVCLCGGSAATIPAAEEILPANLCPLIKSTFGYHLQGSNPFLEMAELIVAETTCDGKKKMYELMAHTRPMHVLELPQKPDDPDAFAHWYAEILKLKLELERRFKVEISDGKLREGIRAMNRERRLRRELAATMKADAPPLSGRELLEYKSILSCIPVDLDMYEEALREVAAKPPGSGTDRVRVLMTGVPLAHGSERVMDLLEERGGRVVAMENCTGLKPILEDVDEQAQDPLLAIARKYFHLPCSVMTRNTRRFDLLKALAAEYRADCVVELVWQACLTYDIEAAEVRRLVTEELKLPYLRIVTDYAPSDTARIAVRIEALYETIRGGAPLSCSTA